MVVEFWATWCPPCRQSIPHLNEMQKTFPKVQFLGVSNEKRAPVEQFVRGMGAQMSYRVAVDPTGATEAYSRHFAFKGIPAAVVIDKHGNMVWSGHPMEPAFEEAVRKADAEVMVDLSKESAESLGARSVKELKALAATHRISLDGCVEKSEIVARLQGK